MDIKPLCAAPFRGGGLSSSVTLIAMLAGGVMLLVELPKSDRLEGTGQTKLPVSSTVLRNEMLNRGPRPVCRGTLPLSLSVHAKDPDLLRKRSGQNSPPPVFPSLCSITVCLLFFLLFLALLFLKLRY